MKKYIINTLLMMSAIMALPVMAQSEASHSASFGQPKKPQTIAYNAGNSTVTYSQGIRVRYYPNHVIIADSYSKEVIRSIAQLCLSLGWDTVYITNLPDSLQDYAIRYFTDLNISLNEFSPSQDEEDENTTFIYFSPYGFPDYYWNEDNDIDDNSVGFFYPYDGGYHGHGGTPYRRHYNGSYHDGYGGYGGGVHYRHWEGGSASPRSGEHRGHGGTGHHGGQGDRGRSRH